MNSQSKASLENLLLDGDPILHKKFRIIKDGFVPIHEVVVQGASLADGGLLTGHGLQHIERVCAVISSIVSQARIELANYEIFIILVAAQIHDVGNVIGRVDHEKKAHKVWSKAIGQLGFDALDRSLAEQIAAAHGGKVANDKNTIGKLPPDGPWNNQMVRPRFLAALLRLADELAEDRDRSATVLAAFDRIPRENEIYHIYAGGLHSTIPEAESSSVRLSFAFSEDLFLRRLGKGTQEQFLLDEVYSRVLKMWHECTYCSRFFPGFSFTKVHVEILIFAHEDENNGAMTLIRDKIRFYIEESGYPTGPKERIFDLCDDLNDFRGGGRLTADRLIAMLKGSDGVTPVPATKRAESGGSSRPALWAKVSELMLQKIRGRP